MSVEHSIILKSFLPSFCNQSPAVPLHTPSRQPLICHYSSVLSIIIYKWHHAIYRLYYFFLILSLSIMFLRIVHVVACVNVSFFFILGFFFCWVVFHSVDKTVCSYIHHLMDFWVIPILDYYEYCYGNLHISLSVDICFHFSWVNN